MIAWKCDLKRGYINRLFQMCQGLLVVYMKIKLVGTIIRVCLKARITFTTI